MINEKEKLLFSQIHIDAARNATDDFNPFHDPYKWDAIHRNPFGSTIVLGFQLEALAAYRVGLLRRASGESRLISDEGLNYANYQFGFADVVRPDDEISLDIRPTINKIPTAGRISNRVIIRKGASLAVKGTQHESRELVSLPHAEFSGFGDLEKMSDRSFVGPGGRYFLKKKFMNTSNAKNFLVGSLIDQHDYFDELEDRVRFPVLFPVSLISCALLEKAHLENYDFFGRPMVYTNHSISVDRRLAHGLQSNDLLNILVENIEVKGSEKGLGKSGIPQTLYHCFGLLAENRLLFRAEVRMALLEDVAEAKAGGIR